MNRLKNLNFGKSKDDKNDNSTKKNEQFVTNNLPINKFNMTVNPLATGNQITQPQVQNPQSDSAQSQSQQGNKVGVITPQGGFSRNQQAAVNLINRKNTLEDSRQRSDTIDSVSSDGSFYDNDNPDDVLQREDSIDSLDPSQAKTMMDAWLFGPDKQNSSQLPLPNENKKLDNLKQGLLAVQIEAKKAEITELERDRSKTPSVDSLFGSGPSLPDSFS